jgi:hypothetical protein
VRKPTPDQLRLRAELAQAQATIIGHLRRAVDSELSNAGAQSLLEQVSAWEGWTAHALARHLDNDPQALVAPGHDCPKSLVKLLPLLVAAGHADKITPLSCAECGRSDPPPLAIGPAGRACGRCAARHRHRPCARCGTVRVIKTRRPEGGICGSCRATEPDAREPCADCGRAMQPHRRLPDGTSQCQRCTPKKLVPCCRCGFHRRANARTPDGPVCGACYSSAPRLCGICGTLAPIMARATDSQPDTCRQCLRRRVKLCSVCGRHRPGRHIHGGTGPFHCESCVPQPVHDCSVCGRNKPVKTFLPLGPVCSTCYRRGRTTPRTCSSCSRRRIIVGRATDGGDLCITCSAADQPSHVCSGCAQPGDLLPGDICPRCTLEARVTDLLRGDDRAVPERLGRLAAALSSTDNPYRTLERLRGSPVARLLVRLAGQPDGLTHDALDALPQNVATAHVRGLLVSAGILAARDENLALLSHWVTRTLTTLPPAHVTLIRAFAEWHVLRDARRRSARGRYTYIAYKGDANNVRAATRVLAWLDEQHLTLTLLDQAHLDVWASDRPTLRASSIPFIRWATARGLTTVLTIAHLPNQQPSHFQVEDVQHDELQQCLTDTSLPHEVRIAGALTRLYALPLTRIVELTAGHFHRDTDNAYLTISRRPVILPPSLAQLIEDQITATTPHPHHGDDGTGFLLPGRSPGRARNPAGLSDTMRRHGLAVRAARNTAMMQSLADLPPIVIADLFGIHPGTAHRWAQFAGTSWSDYLAARAETAPVARPE